MDPEDHHVFGSLGCATENLMQAALVYSLTGGAQLDAAGNAVRVMLEPTQAQPTIWFTAKPLRQGALDRRVGRCDERFALQAAAPSVCNAFLSQPVEAVLV
jgi:hypothetical protein